MLCRYLELVVHQLHHQQMEVLSMLLPNQQGMLQLLESRSYASDFHLCFFYLCIFQSIQNVLSIVYFN